MTDALQTGTDTPKINPNHPRIKKRTPEQQKYRDELARILKADRKLGEVGKFLAKKTLEDEQKTSEYIMAEYGFTKKGLDMLIKANELGFIVENLDKFQGLNHNEIAKALIKAEPWRAVVANLDNFQGLNHKEIAKALIKAEPWRAVAANLAKFEGLDQEIAKTLIEAGKGEDVAENLAKFQGLDQEIAQALIEDGQ